MRREGRKVGVVWEEELGGDRGRGREREREKRVGKGSRLQERGREKLVSSRESCNLFSVGGRKKGGEGFLLTTCTCCTCILQHFIGHFINFSLI